MPEIKYPPGVEIKRLPSLAREAFQILCGIEAALNTYQKQFEPIVRRHKTGWRDFRLIQKKLEQINTVVVNTLPEDQKRTLVAQMRITDLRMVVRKVDEIPTDQWVVDRGDQAYLINKAAETLCLMCDGSCRNECRFRKIVLDSPVDVQAIGMATMPCFSGNKLDI